MALTKLSTDFEKDDNFVAFVFLMFPSQGAIFGFPNGKQTDKEPGTMNFVRACVRFGQAVFFAPVTMVLETHEFSWY